MTPHDTHDRRVRIELAWCPECQVDCFMEVVVLADDPGPVAICADCGLGVDLRGLPGMLDSWRAEAAAPHIARAS